MDCVSCLAVKVFWECARTGESGYLCQARVVHGDRVLQRPRLGWQGEWAHTVALFDAVYCSTKPPSSPRQIPWDGCGSAGVQWWQRMPHAHHVKNSGSNEKLGQEDSAVPRGGGVRWIRSIRETWSIGRSGEIGGASRADAVNAANMRGATHYWQELCGILPCRYIKLFQPTSPMPKPQPVIISFGN